MKLPCNYSLSQIYHNFIFILNTLEKLFSKVHFVLYPFFLYKIQFNFFFTFKNTSSFPERGVEALSGATLNAVCLLKILSALPEGYFVI